MVYFHGFTYFKKKMSEVKKRTAEKKLEAPKKKQRKYLTKCGCDCEPHEQVEVEAPFGTVSVDKGMVDTLKMIWAQGYHTYLSCQNSKGKVFICFDNVDFEKLVKHAYSTHEKDQATAFALGEKENLPQYYVWFGPETLYSFLRNSDICYFWQDDGYTGEDKYWVSGKNVMFEIRLRFDIKLHDRFKKLFKRSHTK